MKWVIGLLMFLGVSANAQIETNKIDSATTAVWSIRVMHTYPLSESAPMAGQFPAPAIYHRWSKELADCAGFVPLPDSLIDSIRFVEVNARDFQINDITDVAYFGVSVPSEGVMYLAMSRVWDEWIVKHEFLHFYIWLNHMYDPKNEHNPKYFGHCNTTLD